MCIEDDDPTKTTKIPGLIGQQTGSGGRHRNGRRRAVTLAANRIDSTSSDEFDGNNDAKNGSNGGSSVRRYHTLRRRNSRDLLNSDAPPKTSSTPTTTTTTTEAICHDPNAQLKTRFVPFFICWSCSPFEKCTNTRKLFVMFPDLLKPYYIFIVIGRLRILLEH